MYLPHHEILEKVNNLAKEHDYNLRSLNQNTQFSENVKKLIDHYMNNIEYRHLRTQKEAEASEMDEHSDTEKEEERKEVISGSNLQEKSNADIEEDLEEYDNEDEMEISKLATQVHNEIERA